MPSVSAMPGFYRHGAFRLYAVPVIVTSAMALKFRWIIWHAQYARTDSLTRRKSLAFSPRSMTKPEP